MCGVWYLAIGVGALRSCVIPNKRTNELLEELAVLHGAERETAEAGQSQTTRSAATSFAPSSLGIADSVARTMCHACLIYLEPKQHCCKVRCPSHTRVWEGVWTRSYIIKPAQPPTLEALR